MAQDKRYRNNPAIESLYAWYPEAVSNTKLDIARGSPKDIYMNLGSRHPQDKSYIETEMYKQYHQNVLRHEQRQSKPSIDQQVTVKPPWALNFEPLPNKPVDKEDLKNRENERRIKSACNPSLSITKIDVPKDRIILKIPKPELYNLFDVNMISTDNLAEENKCSRPNTSMKQRPKTSISSIRSNNSNEFIANRDVTASRMQINKVDDENTSNLGEYNDNLNLEYAGSLVPSGSLADTSNFEESYYSSTNNKDLNDVIQVLNVGKKPIVNQAYISKTNNSKLNRPKTAGANVNNQQMTQPQNELPRKHAVRMNQTAMKRAQSCTLRREKTVDMSTSQPQINQVVEENKDYIVRAGHWKDDLLNRGKYAHIRPQYFTRIDLEKIKAAKLIPEVHYKANETFFYNTIPVKKATFVINPNFITENLPIAKLKYGGQSSSQMMKFSRDYAFVY